MTDTTVSLGKGSRAGRGYDHAAGLQRVYRDALDAGLGEEGARAAVAIAQTEGGLGGAEGDVAGGGSAGSFQLYFGGGQGDNFARAHGMTNQQAKAYLLANPHAGNKWALRGYLGNAIRDGLAKGLRGQALATHAQRVGQVSVTPERAGQNYQALYRPGGGGPTGGGPKVQLQVTPESLGDDANPTGMKRPPRTQRMQERVVQLGKTAESLRKEIEGLSKRSPEEIAETAGQAENPMWKQNAASAYQKRKDALDRRQADLAGVEADIRKIETDVANDPDAPTAGGTEKAAVDLETARIDRDTKKLALDQARKAALAETDPLKKRQLEAQVTKAEAEAEAAQRALEKADEPSDVHVGRRIVRKTPGGDYETVYTEPDEITAYQGASLSQADQRLEFDKIKQAYEEKKLSYDQAEKAIDRILNRPLTTTVEGKRYEAGFEPGGGDIKHFGRYGFKADPRPYTDVDYATLLGAPQVNQGVYSDDYPFAQPGLSSGAPMRRPVAVAPPPEPAPAPVAPVTPPEALDTPGYEMAGVAPPRAMPTGTPVAPAPAPVAAGPPPGMAAPPNPALGQAPVGAPGMQRPGGGEMNLMRIKRFLESNGVQPGESDRIAQEYLKRAAGGVT